MRDAESFDDFYRGTSVRLMRYGTALVGDPVEAQDLVQEGYARAWWRWAEVSRHPNPEGWLRVTVGRLAVDRYRRLRRWRQFASRSGPPPPIAAPNEALVHVVTALRRLPIEQRQALAMYYLFDLPVSEISAETGAPVGTVKSWLARGRAGLAAVLATGEVEA